MTMICDLRKSVYKYKKLWFNLKISQLKLNSLQLSSCDIKLKIAILQQKLSNFCQKAPNFVTYNKYLWFDAKKVVIL